MENAVKKKGIKISQLVLMFILVIPGGKFLSLIAIMATDIGRDTPLGMAILFVFDLLTLTAVLIALKLNKERKSFYRILCDSLGVTVAKVVMALYFIIFLLRTMLLLVNTIQMFSSTYSVKTNWLAYSIPICALIVFILWLGPNTLARLSETLFTFILLALLSILCLSAKQAEFANLAPVCERGLPYLLSNLPKYTFWFSESMFLLFFADNLPRGKTRIYPLYIAFFVGVLICVGLATVFIGLFDTLAPYNNLAMSKVSQFMIKQTINGRLDWLSLGIWLMSAYIKTIIMAYCMLKCLNFIMGKREGKFSLIPAIAMLLPVLIVPLFVDVEKTILTYLCERWPRYILWICQYLLLLFAPFAVLIGRRKTIPSGYYTAGDCSLLEQGKIPKPKSGKYKFSSVRKILMSKRRYEHPCFHTQEPNQQEEYSDNKQAQTAPNTCSSSDRHYGDNAIYLDTLRHSSDVIRIGDAHTAHDTMPISIPIRDAEEKVRNEEHRANKPCLRTKMYVKNAIHKKRSQ